MFLDLLGVHNFWLYLMEFIVAAVIIFYAGAKLSLYGDKIASGSKFSHGWIGFILLASITSLPELITGFSATGIVGNVDLLVSDTLGSNAFNIVLLSLMFLLLRKKIINFRIEQNFTGAAGLLLTSLVGIYLLFQHLVIAPWISWLWSALLFGLYLIVVFLTYRIGGLKEEGEQIIKVNEKYIGLKFAISTALIVASAVWMTVTAEKLTHTPIIWGEKTLLLGSTFVGTLFLAIATSLPEMSVTFSAARIGSIDMAIGDIFGSNIFNIMIIPIASLFYQGVLWKDVSFNNFFIVILIFILTNLTAMDLINRTRMKKAGFSVFNLVIILLWIFGLYIILETKGVRLLFGVK